MNDIKVFIVNNCYDYPIYQGDCYVPISTGVANMNSRVPDGYLCDNVLDNISFKNPTYAELTAHYWIWKNCTADIVGVVHYRRYFVSEKINEYLDKKTLSIRGHRYKKVGVRTIDIERFILDADMISDYLDRYDLIVKEQVNNEKTVEELFTLGFGSDFCNKIKNVIAEYYPAYLNAVMQVLGSHSHYHCNMFVGKKKVMDGYWKWIFDVLSKLESRGIDFKPYTDIYDKRYAYATELLFKVWIITNNIKHTSCPVIKYGRTTRNLETPLILPFKELPFDAIRSVKRRLKRR